MIAILIGLLFIFLDVNIGGIHYTPHWIGYALVLLGLARQAESPERNSALAVSAASILAGGALWVAALFGYGMAFPLPEILQLFLTYRLLVWCEAQEEMGESYLISRFRMTWYALAAARVAATVLGVFMPPQGWVWSAVAFVAGLVYTYTFYRLSTMVER